MNKKLKRYKELNSQLNLIEKQYLAIGSQVLKRRKGLTLLISITTFSISISSISNTSISISFILAFFVLTSSVFASATTSSFMLNLSIVNFSNLVFQIYKNKPNPQNFSNKLSTTDN
ncbi:hypothetical protein F8M41_018040 [Gigaspora margarita]|uniref:Uncharacterized protein n=1 Tax=Gigaspora margarita TaxID=4874 RepID=A0A8H4AM33_GIGMA|nr:hypothetical protein F8M41_018040 [Gigaspora margarita]